MASPVTEKIMQSCVILGSVDLGGVKLEDGNPSLLNVAEFNLDMHVAIQPQAIAYFGALKKDASRRLSALRRSFERWEKKKYAEAKASLGVGTGKTTVADIEARYITDNEAEIQKWDDQIDKAQLEFDTLDVWFEAWRQKAFSIREFAGIEETERYNSSSSLSSSEAPQKKNLPETGIDRVRRILKKHRAEGASKG